MLHHQFGWKTVEGLILHGQLWQPKKEVIGVVSLVHGLGEHSGRYEHLATFLNEAGYIMTAFDLRGHGKSEGQRGHAKSYETLLDDITNYLTEVNKYTPACPHFLYGHSLGGGLVINYVLRRQPKLRGIVASAPYLKLAFNPPAWKLILGNLVYYLEPTFSQPNSLNPQDLSRDTAVVEAYISDPLVHNCISARLALDSLHAGQWALDHAANLTLDLLIMHGDTDRITSGHASADFAAQAGERCQLKFWESMYHEIHNEPEQTLVFNYLRAWLDKQLSMSN